MKQTKQRGFSLLELMIAVVIVSIITTLAVNSYQGSVRKARRADAKADLMELAQLLERNYTETNSFTTDINGNAVTLAYNVSPQQGPVFYDLTLPVQTTTTYTIAATPRAPQDRDVRCLALTLNQAGNKTIGAGATGTVAECW